MCGKNTGRRARAGCLLLLTFATAGCAAAGTSQSSRPEPTAEAGQEIKGGYPDGDDRAIAGLLITDRLGRVARTCSSMVIAPNLVLTAQHCVADTPKLIACKTATFGDVVDAGHVFVTLGSSMWAADTPWVAARQVLRPQDGNAVCGRDLALIVLASPLPSGDVTPLTPRIDRPAEVSEAYSAVGFGDTEGDERDSGERDSGERRRRDGLVVECVGYGCGTQERVAGNEWRGETGICSGDSGGPALDSAGRIIGVTSRGPAGCADPIYSGLIAHRDWLTREARRAADLGGYDVPTWAAASSWVGAPPSRAPLDERWTSCAYSPPPRRALAPAAVAPLAPGAVAPLAPGAVALLAPGAVALLALLRRRRSDCRGRHSTISP